jgi:NodT family efflux transporter outer membrane factor (OMF) lipoprotein
MSSKPCLLAMTACAIGLAGCSLVPKYSRPSVDTPGQFGEAATSNAGSAGVVWATAQPRDDQTRGHWWEMYGDAQLDTLEERATGANQTILAAAANFRAARAAAVGARSALFPTLSVAPAFNRMRASHTLESAEGTTLDSNAPAAVNDYLLPVDASYEIDLWGSVRASAAASAASAQASAADLATALLSTQAELAQDYFQLRAIDVEQQIVDDTVVSYRQSLDETRTLFRTGIDSAEDVARAETQLNTAVAQATDLGVARAAFEHAIAVLIGRAPAAFRLAPASLPQHIPTIPAGVPSDLLQRRPDIAAAERRVAAANAQIGVTRAAWFPNLTLGASAGWQTSTASQWFEWPSRFWSVGPQLAGVLFDGGARRAQSEQARAVFDQATANYRQAVLSAFQTVEDNLAAVRILTQEAREQRIAVESSQHLLDLANTRFKLGIDSYLNVITAQTTLLSNRETEVQIQLRQMIASISLVKALGGGWDVTQLSALPQSRDPSPDPAGAVPTRRDGSTNRALPRQG